MFHHSSEKDPCVTRGGRLLGPSAPHLLNYGMDGWKTDEQVSSRNVADMALPTLSVSIPGNSLPLLGCSSWNPARLCEVWLLVADTVAMIRDSLALARKALCVFVSGEFWAMSENLFLFSEESLSSSCGLALFPLRSIYEPFLLFIYLLNLLSHDSARLSRTLGLCFLVTAESEPSHFTDKTELSMFVLSIKQACQHCTHRLVIFMWGVSTRTRLPGFLLDRQDAMDGITVL